MTWTQAQADTILLARVRALPPGIDYGAPWWRELDPVRAAVLVNIAYNFGVTGLMAFHKMLAAAQAGDWDTAGAEIVDSQIAPNRARRLSVQMETGVAV